MKVRLFHNLKVDDGQVMFAGVHEDTQNSFPSKLYREIDMHRQGTQPRTTLEILQDDQPKSAKSGRKTSRSKK